MRVRPLPKKFYLPSAADIAPALLGAVVKTRIRGLTTTGRIVEVEAYIRGDEACHANRGKTRRNASMFGPPGHAYVYRIHQSFCLNLVTCQKGIAEAVLIRAIEPLKGLPIMLRRRKGAKGRLLTAGPGRVCQALGLNLSHDGLPLGGPELTILSGPPPDKIETSARIGISKNVSALLRFFDPASPYLSR
jgi:DNA-3-methyladenine glycosylase